MKNILTVEERNRQALSLSLMNYHNYHDYLVENTLRYNRDFTEELFMEAFENLSELGMFVEFHSSEFMSFRSSRRNNEIEIEFKKNHLESITSTGYVCTLYKEVEKVVECLDDVALFAKRTL